MRITRKTELPNLAVLAGMFLAAAVLWPSSPDRFPVHWNFQGQIDRYGGKTEGLLIFPVMTLGIYLLLVFLPRLDPARANYARFSGAYAAIRIVFTVSMALMYAVTLLSGNGYPIDVGLAIPLIVGGLFIVIGNFMGKIRPNWFVGIRTPWTLTSRKSWVKTHRLGGWMFIASGVVLILASLARTPWALMLMGAWFAVFVVWMFAYSYLIWRSDPERRSLWTNNGEQ